MCAPLFELLKKDVPYEWTEEFAEAYRYLKKALTAEPILVFPDFQKQFTLSTAASSNNRSLKYIFDRKPSKNPKLKRYALELQGLAYEVEHV